MAINKDAVMELVMKGKCVIVAEYRSSRAEFREWRDKATQRVMSGNFLRHTVETEDGALTISDKLAEGVKAEDYRCPYTKGQMIVVHVRRMSEEKGNVSIYGSLDSLEPAAVVPLPKSKAA
jgi:hypothetical protein